MSINNGSPSFNPLHSLPPRTLRGHIRLHPYYESPVYRPRTYLQDVAQRRYSMAKLPERSQRLPNKSVGKPVASAGRKYSQAQNPERRRDEDRDEDSSGSTVTGFLPRSTWQWPEVDGEQDDSVGRVHTGDDHSSAPASYDFGLNRANPRSAPPPTPRLSQSSLVPSPSYSESLENVNTLLSNTTIEDSSPIGLHSGSASTWQSLYFFPKYASSTDQQLAGLGIGMSFDEPEDTDEA